MQNLCDLNRVGHDGQIGDVDEVIRELPGRGSGGHADRRSRPDPVGGRNRDRVLLGKG